MAKRTKGATHIKLQRPKSQRTSKNKTLLHRLLFHRTQGPKDPHLIGASFRSLSSHPFLKSFVALGSWQTPLTRKATEAVPARKSRKSWSQTVTNAAKHFGHILKWDSGLFDLFVARNFRGRKFRFTRWLAAFCKPKNCTYQFPLGRRTPSALKSCPKLLYRLFVKADLHMI